KIGHVYTRTKNQKYPRDIRFYEEDFVLDFLKILQILYDGKNVIPQLLSGYPIELCRISQPTHLI
ncbi:MAG TPA: hypothetical protein PLX23_10440, partial [Candidatus Hydrogenedens sp.]|nr:hypothetical protein [Candidatus Hydrogenedens sp.]